MFARKTIDDETWSDLEDALISADFGPDITDSLIEELRASTTRPTRLI
jgi:fused signal recognition particle receptor